MFQAGGVGNLEDAFGVGDQLLFFELGDFSGDGLPGQTGQRGDLGVGDFLVRAEATGVEESNGFVIGVAGKEGLDDEKIAVQAGVNTLY